MKKKGETLIEIILSICILSIVITGVLVIFTNTGTKVGANAIAIQQISEAKTKINSIISDDEILDGEYDNVTKTTINVLGSDVPVYYIEENIENFLNTDTNKKIVVYKSIPEGE